SGAPAGAVCTTSPATASVGSGMIPVEVSVTTTAAAAVLNPGAPRWWWIFLAISALVLLELGRARRLRLALLVFAGSCAWVACGGPSTSLSTTHPVTPTPAGTYILTVTAASSGAPAGQTQVTLVVD
ncbi:MAG: hypothetical protein ACRD2D_02240, partial [Terriglobales bacterium]